MYSLLQSGVSVTTPIEVEFPNLFGGLAIEYFKGFQIFGISIYWYGVLITLGVVLAYIYAMPRAKEFGLNRDRVFDVVFAALIGGFIGARAYYCIFHNLDPDNVFKYDIVTAVTTIRDGGLAIYGGIIGALIVGFVACKIRKVNFLAMCDMASLGFLIGQGLGRWGNFINQEAYGAECSPDYIFGMSGDIIASEMGGGVLVHPCFLYESLWCLLGFVLLHFYSKKLRTFDGELILLYVAWYGLERAVVEGLRTDSLMIGDFRVSQLLAAGSFVIATVLFIVFKIVTEKKQIPLYVNTDACKALMELDAKAEEEYKAKKAAKKAAKEGVAESILSDDADEVEDVVTTDTPAETDVTEEPKSDESETNEATEENNIAQSDEETNTENNESEEQSNGSTDN